MADVSAILGTGPAPQQPTPLDTLAKWQALTNAQTQNESTQQGILNQKQELENLKLTNQKGQTELATTQVNRNSQIMFGLLSLNDDEIGPATLRALDEQLATKQMDPQRYAVLKQKFLENVNNPKALRNIILPAFVGGLAGPEALKAMTPTVTDTNMGGTNQPRVTPSPVQLLQGVQPQITNAPGAATRTMSPESRDSIVYIKMPDGTLQRTTGGNAPALIGQGGVPVDQNGQPLAGQPAPGAQPAPSVRPAPGAQPVPGVQGTPGKPPAAPAPTSLPPAPAPVVPPPRSGNIVPNDTQIGAAQKSQDEANTAVGALSSTDFNDRNASLNTIRTASPEALANMGKGTESLRNYQQILTNLAPGWAKSLNIDPNAMTKTQEIMKAFARIATSAGNRSDADLFTRMSGNPNAEMSGDALVHVSSYIMGLNLQEYVLTQQAYKQATHQPLDQNTFYGPTRTRVQGQIDPNVFQHYYHSDHGEDDKYYYSLDKAGKAKYKKTLDLIKDSNVQPQVSMP